MCDIPVRVISLSDAEYENALRKIEQAGNFTDVQRWNGVRGKDVFEKDMTLRRDYRQILQKKYPQVSLPHNVSLLSPQAEKSLHTGEKSRVYDFHNAGAVGCALSHISAWQYIVENRLPAMIIFESDVDFATKEFCSKLQSILQNYAEDFDALNFNLLPIPFPWTDHTELTNTAVDDVQKVNGIAFRMQGYLLTNAGAKKLLQNAFPLTCEIDSYMTIHTMLPSSDFKMIATKEPWLNHPVIVFDSSIGYSPLQCLTDAISFVPASILVVLIALFIILLILVFIFGTWSFAKMVFANDEKKLVHR